MTDTVIPIHRHTETSETVIVCRGKVREEFYDAEGNKTAEFVMEAGGECPGVQVPMGQYHTLVCLEDGSVIFEAKDRPYDPVGTEEFFWRGRFLNKAFDYGSKGCKFVTSHYQGCFSSKE